MASDHPQRSTTLAGFGAALHMSIGANLSQHRTLAEECVGAAWREAVLLCPEADEEYQSHLTCLAYALELQSNEDRDAVSLA